MIDSLLVFVGLELPMIKKYTISTALFFKWVGGKSSLPKKSMLQMQTAFYNWDSGVFSPGSAHYGIESLLHGHQ